MKHKLTPEEMNRLDIDAFRQAEKAPVVIILDNVRSQHNVGSAFRTADAFRLEGVCLCGITAVPPSAEIHKTALGAEDSVRWQHFPTALDAVLELRSKGYRIYAVEQVSGSIPLQNFCTVEIGRQCSARPNGTLDTSRMVNSPVALIFGNEVHGVSQEALDSSDGAVEIPQYGTKHSLNVSVSIGIVLWALLSSFLRT